MIRLYSGLVILAGLAACSPAGDASGGGGASVGATAAAAAPQAPDIFAFGQEASPERIALWDVDVRPDGTGLPPGTGSVAEGAEVYVRECASCHGMEGEGGPGGGGALVGTEPWEDFPSGRAVGSYWPYATTLYDYIVRAMPQLTPGSLSADETYAVIAWILHQNALVSEEAVMNAETLPAVEMPARDRFVPDDRQGGPIVR